MKFRIVHEIRGRMRIHIVCAGMSFKEADILQYYLQSQASVKTVKVYERNQDAAICYTGEREGLIRMLRKFSFSEVSVPEYVWQNSGREVNREYWDKIVGMVLRRIGSKILLPMPVRNIMTVVKSVKYIGNGIRTLAKGKIEVAVLDGTAITVSLLRGDMKTAGSVMFLLGVGEVLEEWTHKKSVDDLARSMSLNISRVWLLSDGKEVLVDTDQIRQGDRIVIRMGSVIPFDGVVVEGNGEVNQASMTGEGLPVSKEAGAYVYAGTVLEAGELVVSVKETSGSNKYEKIVRMIEESERLKSSMEGNAAHLADKLVPYTLLGTAAVYLLTRNTQKALSVLMVDFSCALKLSMPIAVLSAIREAGGHKITVKGGKFLEKAAEADTIIFDKTGTLTKAHPTVVELIPFVPRSKEELLGIAACLEEHFPHSMAKAVVQAAKEQEITHEERHSKVEYIVAHGISSSEDPLREEAAEVVAALKRAGFGKVVMMTGDSERTARAIACKVGVDEYYSEVLPEDKAAFVEKEKKAGRTVIMVGDGMNDSPALSAADVGIAISDGAQLAREVADITIDADRLYGLVTLRKIGDGLLKRIRKNYVSIMGINSSLILLGVSGLVQPTASALVHNASTLAISLNSMKDLIKKEEINAEKNSLEHKIKI